jgi:putative spermidine/putrescine transport system permease protein
VFGAASVVGAMVFLVAPTVIVLLTSFTSVGIAANSRRTGCRCAGTRRCSTPTRCSARPGTASSSPSGRRSPLGGARHRGALAVGAQPQRRWLRARSICCSCRRCCLPALAFGFAALIYVNKLGFSPEHRRCWCSAMSSSACRSCCAPRSPRCRSSIRRCSKASYESSAPAVYDLSPGDLAADRRAASPAGAFLAFMASFDNVPVSLFLADERTEVLPIHLWQQIDTNLDVRTAAASG